MYDFAQFYCGGRVLDDGGDPYRYEPLHTCEQSTNLQAFRNDPKRALPVLLPPYALAVYMPLARLDFAVARAVYASLIVVAVVACIAILAALGTPWDVAAAALVLSAGYLLLNAGQSVPLALLALVACGWALAKRRAVATAVFGSLTLIEPHIGLPVFVALLLFGESRTRVALIVLACALGAVSVEVAGPNVNVEYLFAVLPAQAHAEVGYVYQYSLTYLLQSLGMAQHAALVLGDLSYAFFAAAGIWLGLRLSRSLRTELLVFVPGAFAVIGGPYIHMVDMCFAIPAALTLATYSRGSIRTIATVSTAFLAIPWLRVWTIKNLFAASLFVCGWLMWRLAVPATIALIALGVAAVTIYLFELNPPSITVLPSTESYPPGELAVAAWRHYVARIAAPGLNWLAIKIPTWGALGALAAACGLALTVRDTEG